MGYRSGGTDCSACKVLPEGETAATGNCPSQCMACIAGGLSDGGVALKGGKCTMYCSKYGYCGTTDSYRRGGADCSACGDEPVREVTANATCPSKCLSCQGGSPHDGGVPLENGKCMEHCSKHGYCGTTDRYHVDGTDCAPCKILAPDRATTDEQCPARCTSCQAGGASAGGVALDSRGTCTKHCSKFGFCGTTEMYQADGTDCSACQTASSQAAGVIVSISGAFVVTLEDASRILEDAVTKAALEISIAKQISTSFDVDRITEYDARVELTAAEAGSGRRLRRLSNGVLVSYTIVARAAPKDEDRVASVVAHEMNAKSPTNLRTLVNDAIEGASANAPKLGGLQVSDVVVKRRAAPKRLRDEDLGDMSSNAPQRWFPIATSVLLVAIAKCSLDGNIRSWPHT